MQPLRSNANLAHANLVVREARPEDDATIGDLLVDAFRTAYAAKMPEYEVPEKRQRDLRAVAEKREAATVLVAERDNRIVGTVALFRPGAKGTQTWLPNTADLRHLATDPALHGQGLSGPLLDETERIARGWGVDAISLHVRRGLKGVMALYERRGYRRAPEGDLELPGNVSLTAYVLPLK
jgi:predicted N-acetyltransferase YhbS